MTLLIADPEKDSLHAAKSADRNITTAKKGHERGCGDVAQSLFTRRCKPLKACQSPHPICRGRRPCAHRQAHACAPQASQRRSTAVSFPRASSPALCLSVLSSCCRAPMALASRCSLTESCATSCAAGDSTGSQGATGQSETQESVRGTQRLRRTGSAGRGASTQAEGGSGGESAQGPGRSAASCGSQQEASSPRVARQ